MTRDHPVPLGHLLNATAATWDSDRAAGFVNAWGNSFPAEELPFGRAFELGGRTFMLAPKVASGPDHLEALGQTLHLDGARITGLAALCFGEMGDRTWAVSVDGPDGELEWILAAPGWLVDRDAEPGMGHLVASHLHYAGGYELDDLRPVAWRVEAQFPRAIRASSLRLSVSPLVHILALTIGEIIG